ncbi:MAG: hypothetical protein N3B01_08680, partial [Verrucomicrobiae bacterium]|nr:hypothetical protein [Verrucomicrobiae bacterium]
ACVVAFATMFPDREVTLLLFFVLPIRLKAKYLALIAVAADLVPVLEGTGGRVAHLAHLGGAALGWFWVRALGYGRPLTVRWVRFRTRRRRSTEEFIREEIDPILDKIAKHGIESLTRRERRILEAARRRLHTEGRGVR